MWSDGAYVPYASSSPAPVIVWQAAQLRAKRLAPSARLAAFTLTLGMYGAAGESELMKAAISLACALLNLAGLRSACSWSGGAAGIRPVVTQKLTVAGPTPTSGGAASLPSALLPWQLEQVCSNISSPTLM